MYKNSLENKNNSVSLKPRLHKPSVIHSLSVGQVIAVGIAHTYQKDYGWSDYAETYYIIEKISRNVIVGRNEKYKQEMITISRKDLDDYRFELHI